MIRVCLLAACVSSLLFLAAPGVTATRGGAAPRALERESWLSLALDSDEPAPRGEHDEEDEENQDQSGVLKDGGFESATRSGNASFGWAANSSGTHPVIIAEGSYARSGENYAYLGGGNQIDVTLEQLLALPEDGKNIQVSFSVNIVTQEPADAPVRDRFAVEIRGLDGKVLDVPCSLSNRDAAKSGNRPGKYFTPSPLDISAFAGQSVKLVFHVTTDRTRPTVFRVDDVTMGIFYGEPDD